MKIPESSRIRLAAVLTLCLALLGFGYYLQFFQGQEPCPLCIFQRIAYMVVAAVALVVVIGNPRGFGRLGGGIVCLSAAATGWGIAARQVWLQHLPADQVPECGPGLDYMLDVFPLAETVKMVFRGSGECAEVTWRFLGFSIAEWSLFWFTVIAAVALLECHAALRYRRAGGHA